MSECLLLANCKALVVEDNNLIRILIVAALRGAGAEVADCRTGEEAIEAVGKERHSGFDVMLLDLVLPGLDGLRTVTAVRALGFTGSVIGMSAHVTPEVSGDWLAAGCDTVLPKDALRQLLITTVAEACALAGSRKSGAVV